MAGGLVRVGHGNLHSITKKKKPENIVAQIPDGMESLRNI
jgi:hypothetical protein